MSGFVEMSLDEIIASKKRPGGAGGKFGGRGGAAGRQRGEGRAQFTKRVPEGKWKHDKFHELYSGGARTGGRPAPSDNRVLKVNISNLAKSVVTADLEELFGSYKPTNVSVHYDENGRSLGTADVFLHRRDATKLMADFRGISLDGRELKMVLVDESATTSSSLQQRIGVSRGRGPQRNGPRTSGGITKKRSSPVARKGGKQRDEKPKMSAEDLDRELEAYMRKPKPNDIVM
ncbi:hypothetical protein QR680_005120 [Steinernema hermaphroditum]|uniref:RRM domain-containing protein n=1 Tax=Steinernema hermaphroditum TaxID=289476 RepID=A0AA39LUT2_9BILA|nr:hypothetical protein QR680_005120 [Steinernema hermaphroditum]